MLRYHRWLLVLVAASTAACTDCGGPGTDAGQPLPDGGASSSSSSGGTDGGSRDAGRRDGGDGGAPACGPDTEGFGEACGQCGQQGCNQAGQLVCQDPGYNACGVCGQLDTSGGLVGRTCGSCGTVGCADGGLLTECQGEHPPNACGGCGTLPYFKGPPDAGCSSCGTGTWTCSADLDDLWCVRGRAMNACGTCDRCVTYHATLEDLSNGVFILAGTRVLIEDVGRDVAMGTTPPPPPPPDAGVDAGFPPSETSLGTQVLSFEPLLAGPAGLNLESALIYLSPSTSQFDPGAFALSPFFSNLGLGQPGDPLRQYNIYPLLADVLAAQRYVLIYDGFVGGVVARGPLVAGPPP